MQRSLVCRLPMLMLLFGVALPAWAQSRDAATTKANAEATSYLRTCAATSDDNQRWCDLNRTSFIADYQKAKAGDYQGQRNVAFFLAGSMRPVEINPVALNPLQACAWRHVILRTGHARADASDVRSAELDCGKPGVLESAAQARALALLHEIKTAPARMPPPPPRSPQRTGPLDGTARPLTDD